MKLKALIAIGIVVLMGSCTSPYHLVQLLTKDQPQRWAWGKGFYHKSDNGVSVAIAYERNDEKYLYFTVEIENFRPDTLLVSPELFYYNSKQYTDPKLVIKPTMALDPEMVLFKLEKEESVQYANEMNQDAAEVALLLTDIGTDIAVAAVEKKISGEAWEQKQVVDYDLQQIQANHRASLYDSRQTIEFRKDYYSNELIRKTSLPPMNHMTGKVLFPVNYKANEISIVFPFNESNIIFTFNQILRSPY